MLVLSTSIRFQFQPSLEVKTESLCLFCWPQSDFSSSIAGKVRLKVYACFVDLNQISVPA